MEVIILKITIWASKKRKKSIFFAKIENSENQDDHFCGKLTRDTDKERLDRRLLIINEEKRSKQ